MLDFYSGRKNEFLLNKKIDRDTIAFAKDGGKAWFINEESFDAFMDLCGYRFLDLARSPDEQIEVVYVQPRTSGPYAGDEMLFAKYRPHDLLVSFSNEDTDGGMVAAPIGMGLDALQLNGIIVEDSLLVNYARGSKSRDIVGKLCMSDYGSSNRFFDFLNILRGMIGGEAYKKVSHIYGDRHDSRRFSTRSPDGKGDQIFNMYG